MELSNIKRVYLIGIGGIGMSGLARYFHHLGCVVCGYDKTSTELTGELQREGIPVVFDDNTDWIPSAFHTPGENTLIIFTPAVPKDSLILNFFKNNGFELFKRSQVLGIISRGMYTVAVAGTHGKTTTSTMIAHILKDSGKDCSAFLGGISTNYHSNVLYGKNNIVVVEADEYDRSFLTLHPDIAIITSMDADHLDIYGDKSHLTDSFKLFASQIKPGGQLIHKKGLPLDYGLTYAVETEADAYASNIRIKDSDFYFDFSNSKVTITGIRLGIPGTHNVENAVAAIEATLMLDISPDAIKSALGSFAGVKRRFEYIIKNDHQIYIDDYAHHPEELKACINSVRHLYPDKKITGVFQPHLFTRTRDFADDFARALELLDEVILLEIYPARELPIQGIDSKMLLNKINKTSKYVCKNDELIGLLKSLKPELLLTLGAGDIDQFVKPIEESL